MKVVPGYTLFFSEKDEFSNWYMRDFKVKGITFNCMEQYMMYSKAILFKDEKIAREILEYKGDKPQKKYKELGKLVSNFSENIWVAKRENIVTAGLVQKFIQHDDLKRKLLSTKGTRLVEASPYDHIWGVKMGQNDPDITNPEKWRGLNLLGKCLERAREHILRLELEQQSNFYLR